MKPTSTMLRLVIVLSLALLATSVCAQDAAPTPTPAGKPGTSAKVAKSKDGAAMVTVAAGPFFMGCSASADFECLDDEKPARKVEVAAFEIDKTEVTVAQYARCVAAKKCSSKGLTMPFGHDKDQPANAGLCNWQKPHRDQHPINCVDWSQAEAYCAWAGKRLPTEAEWEKAARADDGRKYPWGNAAYGTNGKVANVADDTARKKYPAWTNLDGYDDGYVGTAPVGSFPAGAAPSGALDMIGNVWEWTADKRETGRVVRGASFEFDRRFARASQLGWTDAKVRAEDGGFRCAR